MIFTDLALKNKTTAIVTISIKDIKSFFSRAFGSTNVNRILHFEKKV